MRSVVLVGSSPKMLFSMYSSISQYLSGDSKFIFWLVNIWLTVDDWLIESHGVKSESLLSMSSYYLGPIEDSISLSSVCVNNFPMLLTFSSSAICASIVRQRYPGNIS